MFSQMELGESTCKLQVQVSAILSTGTFCQQLFQFAETLPLLFQRNLELAAGVIRQLPHGQSKIPELGTMT
jgi:hypothetical protein